MKVIHFIRINSAIRSAGILSVLLFSVLFSLTFLPLSLHTDTTEAAPGTATGSTITLDVTNNTASVDLTVSSTNGTFATSTTNNEASFSVTTNNYTGYTLSISAADDTGTLDNGEYNLSSIASNLTESEFNTTTNNGKWGYKPSKYYVNNEVVDNTGEDSVFLSSPTTEATTLDVTSTANNEANSYTIGLGARADYSSSAGTYTKTFTLTAVGNPINYSITYNANADTDTVTNMPYESTNNIQTGDTSSTTITLSNLVPVREGYTFKGWCSITTSDDTCSGTTYNPDGGGTDLTYGIDETTLNSTNIYAIWKKDVNQYKIKFAHILGDIRDITKRTTPCPEMENGGIVVPNDLTFETEATTYTFSVPTNIIPHIDEDCDYLDKDAYDFVGYYVGFGEGGLLEHIEKTSDGPDYNPSTGSFSTLNFWQLPYGSTYYEVYAVPMFIKYDSATVRFEANELTGATTTGMPESFTVYSNYDTEQKELIFDPPTMSYNGKQYTVGSFTVVSDNHENYCDSYISGFLVISCDGLDSVGNDGKFHIKYRNSGYPPLYSPTNTFLRANWKYYLQDMDPTICTTTAVTATDSRDEGTYLIQRLKDNKCWMLDNLALDLVAKKSTLTNANTNASTTTLNYLKNGGGSTSNKYATAAVSNWTSDYSYSAPLIATSGNCYNTTYCVNDPESGKWHKDATTTSSGAGSGKIGVYYNYCAASAGSYCYGDSTSSGNATEDICPKGWRMPTGGSSGEYQALYVAYSSNDADFKNALSTPLSGRFFGDSAREQGRSGSIWSSTSNSSYGIYYLGVNPTYIHPFYDGNRVSGYSVRCLLQ